jgi:hypothetical protein
MVILERPYKEASMAFFKVLTQHFPAGTEENQDSKQGPPCGSAVCKSVF